MYEYEITRFTRKAAARAAACLAAAVTAFSVQAASPLADVAEIASSGGHSCARTLAGVVWCWGYALAGPGDGSEGSYPAPVPVSGLSSGVTAIAVGGDHACAITSGGGLKCWGDNTRGQLGDGTTLSRLTPVDVAGLSSGVTAVWAGGGHSCALTAGGGVKCWGWNDFGQLGDGTTTSRLQPVDVAALGSGVSAGTAAGGHTCVIKGGAAYCWGTNFAGQLGDGTDVTTRSTPAPVSGLGSGVTSIRAGYGHTCAVANGGALMCWGANFNGQLGIGVTDYQRNTPHAVIGLASGVASFGLGTFHTCAVAGGAAKCWGSNSQGQLGNGALADSPAPVSVASFGVAPATITAGDAFSCAAGSDAKVRCWGVNWQGQLGLGTFSARELSPSLVQVFSPVPLENVTSVAAGSHACALLASGGVKCWGSNSYGELGDGSTTARPGPLDVTGLSSGVSAIAAAHWHSCALTSAGGVKCWGRNWRGQLGDGTLTDRTTPVNVSGLSGATAVWTGITHSCAAISGGGVKCWGDGGFGQLGAGIAHSATPVDVAGLAEPVVSGAAGARHTCALTAAGGVKCWGSNANGQLGDGTATSRLQPVDVSGLASGVAAVEAGADFTCARTSGGSVKCWGSNSAGQLGVGTISGTHNVPETAVGLASGVSHLKVGQQTACAVLSAGGVRCWGAGTGLGFPASNVAAGWPTPTDVVYALAGPVNVAVGHVFQCATTTAGRVSCWGTNETGQLGRGFAGSIAMGYSPAVGVFAPQAITLSAVADRDINDSPFTVTASASSGLAVAVTSATPTICTVSGTSVTLVRNGTCVIAGDQPGNLDYLAAPRVAQSFLVTGARTRLTNISTRSLVQTGQNVMIAGFIIAPDQLNQPKTVVIRARGPSLTAQGVTGVLTNPTLRVIRSHDQALLATNDDWQQASNAAAIQPSGFAPLDSAEPAVMLTLSGGLAYTAIVSGADNGSGVAIVEVFEVNAPDVPLFNISTRANVLTGNDVLIGGFIIQGEQPRRVIVRARGPSMAQQGVTGLLQNPILQLFSGQTQIAVNDDWQTDANAGQLGVYAPADPRESAILITLNPGAYTAIVSGVGATTGIGIVEVFAAP